MRWNVLVTSGLFGQDNPEALEKLRAAGCALRLYPLDRAPTEDELAGQVGQADVLICGAEPVTARLLAAAPRLKLIARHGIGFDNVDLDAARARGIPVALVRGAMADSVADLAMGLLLALARHIPQGNASVKAGEWRRFTGTELRGKTLGIVGLGQIGKAMCRRAQGFGMRVVAHDPVQDRAFAEVWAVEYLPLDDLLAQADFVSLHAPLMPDTRGLIGAAQLGRMKATAYLINTARGALVDEAALCRALQKGTIAGAASDVFAEEPPGDTPLLTLDNFIAMPHVGSQTPDSLHRMDEVTADNILRWLRGEEPLYRVV